MNSSKFAYLEIRDRLCEQIQRDGFDIGDKLPTISEIAQRYGVCRNTAIRAISSLVSEGILESRRRAGIHIKEIPKSKLMNPKSILAITSESQPLPGGISNTIMHCLPEWPLLQVRIDEASTEGYCPHALDNFFTSNSYGVYILFSVHRKLKEYFLQTKLPCLLIAGLEDSLGLPSVCYDIYARYYHATKSLIGQGYHNIIFIKKKTDEHELCRPEIAVTEAYNEIDFNQKIQEPVVLEIDETNRSQAEEILSEMLASTEFPAGVVSSSDLVSCWLVQKAMQNDIAIPDQLGIITSNTTEIPTETYPQITGLRSDQKKLGFAAARILTQMLGGSTNNLPQTVLPFEPPFLIQRHTTRSLIDTVSG